MKFKLWRNLSLIFGIWSLASFFYIVAGKFERWSCCALEAKGYKAFTLAQYLIEVRESKLIDCAPCDIVNLPVTYNIVPIDLLVVSLMFLGVFAFMQFRK